MVNAGFFHLFSLSGGRTTPALLLPVPPPLCDPSQLTRGAKGSGKASALPPPSLCPSLVHGISPLGETPHSVGQKGIQTGNQQGLRAELVLAALARICSEFWLAAANPSPPSQGGRNAGERENAASVVPNGQTTGAFGLEGTRKVV